MVVRIIKNVCNLETTWYLEQVHFYLASSTKNSLCGGLHSDWPSVEISVTLLEGQGPTPPTSSWRSLGNQKINPNYHFSPTCISHHWILTNHPNISIRHPAHLQQKEIFNTTFSLCRPIIPQIFGRKFNHLSVLHLSHFSNPPTPVLCHTISCSFSLSSNYPFFEWLNLATFFKV